MWAGFTCVCMCVLLVVAIVSPASINSQCYILLYSAITIMTSVLKFHVSRNTVCGGGSSLRSVRNKHSKCPTH